MLFNSYGFLLAFLPVFLVVFYVARAKVNMDSGFRDVCKWLIVAASLIFYVPFGLKNVIVLAVSVVVNFALARAMQDSRHATGATGGKATSGAAGVRGLLVVALLLNVVSLLFFKFSGVFFPVAVSFYTFSQISFVVDVCRGEVGEFLLVDYLAFILFFPKLLQGPLMGFGEFRQKLEIAIGAENAGSADPAESISGARVSYELLLRALFLLSMGLFKKVILADTFGKAVDYGFENLMSLGSLEAVLVAVFYSIQLYFDFSGYCDMAAAVCMMIGFELPLNFDSPYKAVNIIDFWKRWHITLTKFFTKYVYIPLGGNRKGTARLYLNLMIVFLLSGLWHGNGWNFIVWGAMHGVLYVITRAIGAGQKAKGSDLQKTGDETTEIATSVARGFKVILTFIYVTLAWVFFRAATIRDALTLIGRMFTGGHKKLATHLSSCFQLDEIWYVIKVTPIMKLSFAWDICLWGFLIVAVVIIFFSQNAITIAKRSKIGFRTTAATAILLLWSIISLAGVSTFLYMNF